MIKFKWYRFIRVLFGARSFVKLNESTKAYAILIGQNTVDAGKALEEIGFVEEWDPAGDV